VWTDFAAADPHQPVRNFWGLTFNMSGRRKHAKRDFGCPLDGGVRLAVAKGVHFFRADQ